MDIKSGIDYAFLNAPLGLVHSDRCRLLHAAQLLGPGQLRFLPSKPPPKVRDMYLTDYVL